MNEGTVDLSDDENRGEICKDSLKINELSSEFDHLSIFSPSDETSEESSVRKMPVTSTPLRLFAFQKGIPINKTENYLEKYEVNFFYFLSYF